MRGGGILPQNIDEEIFNGSYPRLYDNGLSASDYYPSYIDTYVERDVRTVKDIGNLSVLQSSYIIYLLQPDYRNFSKRLVKTPKLYFHDTGL